MALNTVHSQNGMPALDSQESILLNYKNVQLTFHDMKPIPDVMKGKMKGEVFLIQSRVIFLAKDQSKPLKSFSMPFHLIEGLSVEQGIFSANYIRGKINAQSEGGWEGKATFKLTFYSGGAIEFGKAMIQVANHASRGQSPYSPVVYVYESIRVIPLRNRNLFSYSGPTADERRNYAYVPGPPPPAGGYYVPVPSMNSQYGYPSPMYYGSMQPSPYSIPTGTPAMPPVNIGFTPPVYTGYTESPPVTTAAGTAGSSKLFLLSSAPQTFTNESSSLSNPVPGTSATPISSNFNPSTSSMQNYYIPPWHSSIEQPQPVSPAAEPPAKYQQIKDFHLFSFMTKEHKHQGLSFTFSDYDQM
ncbi:WW domain-binding protein 2-like [Pristis pectinata]|uniref:WW domain-binding protein 2-like n=1 Tax=Pristis pectinata TaxID=685728 RepID=UPI00223D605D|nr:WW domain-binding protein 2-like [Pristis pectinata]